MNSASTHIILPGLVILATTLLAALGVVNGHEASYVYLGSLGVSSHGVGYAMGAKSAKGNQ